MNLRETIDQLREIERMISVCPGTIEVVGPDDKSRLERIVRNSGEMSVTLEFDRNSSEVEALRGQVAELEGQLEEAGALVRSLEASIRKAMEALT